MKLLALLLTGTLLVSTALEAAELKTERINVTIPRAETPVCRSLRRDFIVNEAGYGFRWKLIDNLASINLKYGDNHGYRREQERLEAMSDEAVAKGRDITQLLLANNCTPPDHVTNPHTYDVDYANCLRSSEHMGEDVDKQCNIITLALRRAGF